MKWTHEPGEAFPVLALNQNEAKMLTEILAQHARRNVRKKYENTKTFMTVEKRQTGRII